jgi:hypothetical protein
MRVDHQRHPLVGKSRQQGILCLQAGDGEKDDAENQRQNDGKRQTQSRPDPQVAKKHRTAPAAVPSRAPQTLLYRQWRHIPDIWLH